MSSFLLEPRGEYLFLQPPDLVDVTTMKVLAYKVFEVCNELEIPKVLVEIRNRKSPSHNAGELLEIGRFVTGLFQDKIQFAVLTKYRPEVHGFFEAVTDTLGSMIKFFEEEATALEWLGIQG